jgi:hypothetical protein
MIYVGSRYEKEPVEYQVEGKNGTTRPTVMRTVSAQSLVKRADASKTVRWNPAFRIDQIGDRITGDPERWWRVMDANPELLNPWNIKPGTVVFIP